MNEVLETIHLYRNQSRIQNTDHAMILKLQDMLQKTKLSINGKTSSLWNLQVEEVFDSDQSNAYNSHYEVKFEDYPRNHIAAELVNL